MPPYQWSREDQQVHILPGGHWEPPGFLFIRCWPQRLGLGGSQFKITRFLRGVNGRLGRDKDFWKSRKSTHAAFTIRAHKYKELNRVATAGLWRSCFLPAMSSHRQFQEKSRYPQDMLHEGPSWYSTVLLDLCQISSGE